MRNNYPSNPARSLVLADIATRLPYNTNDSVVMYAWREAAQSGRVKQVVSEMIDQIKDNADTMRSLLGFDLYNLVIKYSSL